METAKVTKADNTTFEIPLPLDLEHCLDPPSKEKMFQIKLQFLNELILRLADDRPKSDNI